MQDMAPTTAAAIDEADLLPRLRAGDGEAFEAFVRRFCTPMWELARRILRNDDDASDAVQEAFAQTFRGLDGFDGRSRLGTWFHRIVVNAALMKLRAAPAGRNGPSSRSYLTTATANTTPTRRCGGPPP